MSGININTDLNSVYPSSNMSEGAAQGFGHGTSGASIFAFEGENETLEESSEALRAELQAVQDEQGIIGKAWNGLKNLIGLGVGSNKVEDKIEQFENGEITYEEALEYVETYETKQEGGVNLITNLATGALTAGFAFATGGVGALIGGAAIGGATKAGLKTADRATNEVEGDALDLKQIAKDSITGAVDGLVNAATGGMIKGAVSGQTVKTAVKEGIKQGAKAGAISGAAAGATEYATEAAFEEDVEFKFSDFIKTTATNAAAGGVMGGVIGGVTGGVSQARLNKVDAAKFKVSHDKNLGSVEVKNAEQAKAYLENYNENHPDSPIPESETASVTARLEELSKEAEGLAVRFDSQVDEAAGQINETFVNKADIEHITARSKGQKSIYSKLAKKSLDGKALADTDACYDAIGDALGVRLQMKGLDTDTSRGIVEEILEQKGIKGSYDDFVAYLQTGEDTNSAFAGVSDEILSVLKTKQAQGVVDQLVDGIKTGKLNVTEINNYGDGVTSYFTDEQVLEIVEAYNYAVQKGVIQTGKTFEVVNQNNILKGYNDVSIDGDDVITAAISPDDASSVRVDLKQKTSSAAKESGYTSAQMNIKHKLSDGSVGNGELQIRGTKVNEFADVEHIPYDIRTGKIWGDNKYDSISSLIKNMSDGDFNTYNSYLADTYKTLRLQELGLLPEGAALPDIGTYSFKDLSDEAKELLSYAGLAKLAGHGN